MNLLGEPTIVFVRLPFLCCMAKAVSWTVVHVNSETFDSGNSLKIAMSTVARMCFPIGLVPCSVGLRTTSRQMMYMMPWHLVSAIAQCKLNRHKGACPELFQAIGCFEPTFIEAQQASNMIPKTRLLKSQIKTPPWLEAILTFSNEVFKDWESAMLVGIWMLCYSSWKTFKCYLIIK